MSFKPIASAPQINYKRILLVSDGDDEPFVGYWDEGNFYKERNENLAFAYAWDELPAVPDRKLFPRIPTDEE